MGRTQKTEYQYIEKLFHDNEVRHNRLASIAVLAMGVLFALMGILHLMGLYELFSRHIGIAMIVIGAMSAATFVVCNYLKYDNKYIKGIVLNAIIISSGVMFLLYPLNSNFIMYGPLIISTLYFDTRLTKRIGIVTWLIYVFVMWANIYLEAHNAIVKKLHALEGTDLFANPQTVLSYWVIPHTVVFAITIFVCVAIAKCGKKLIEKNAVEAAKNAKNKAELATAFEIQKASLPSDSFVDEENRFKINSIIRPAKTVGGDYYDYFNAGSKTIFLIADVSDKGLPAAMFMMKAKNLLRVKCLEYDSLQDAIEAVNRELCIDNKDGMFVTLWAACINVDTGIGEYINCGHETPFICHGNGEISVIENTPNMVLGAIENAKLKAYPIILKKGDRILLFTDGMTDAVNIKGEDFGKSRLLKLLEINRDTEGDKLCQVMVDEIDGFCTGKSQYDDMTVLVFDYVNNQNTDYETMTIDSNYQEIENVIDWSNEILIKVDCPEDVRRNLDVVIDEICTNIIDYAYPQDDGKIAIKVFATNNEVNMEFYDSGKPFDPTKTKDSRSGDDIQIGGLGIPIVKTIVDEMTYTRDDEINVLAIKKTWN